MREDRSSLSLRQALSDVLGNISKTLIFPLRQDGSDASHMAAHQLIEGYFVNNYFSREYLLREDPNLSMDDVIATQKEIAAKANAHASEPCKYLLNTAFERIKIGLASHGIDVPAGDKVSYNDNDEYVIQVRQDVAALPGVSNARQVK